jgi:hypothetical protein
MEERVIVDSRFPTVINAPLAKMDIPVWYFSLPDEEYQGSLPAHFAAGSTTARDGRRVSIKYGGNWLVAGGPAPRRSSSQEASPRSPFCVRPQIWLDGAKPLPVPHGLQERRSSTGVTDVDR